MNVRQLFRITYYRRHRSAIISLYLHNAVPNLWGFLQRRRRKGTISMSAQIIDLAKYRRAKIQPMPTVDPTMRG
jgi:hypothetical protein